MGRACGRTFAWSCATPRSPRRSPVIYVLGDINVDVVAAHDGPIAPHSDTRAQITLRPGGQGGNVAGWLAKAGADVTLVGRVGTDPLADVALRHLENVKLHVTRDPERATGTCV